MIKLQGQAVIGNLQLPNEQLSVGLIADADLSIQATVAVNALTRGPIQAIGTPLMLTSP